MKRQIMVFAILFVLLIWGIRVINLNRDMKTDIQYIEYGQEFYNGPAVVRTLQFLLLDEAAYEAKFGVDTDMGDTKKALCLQFEIRNESDASITWDEVFANMGDGFECKGWYSVYDPYMGAGINTFSSEELAPGETEKFWLVTPVSKSCFREKTWDELSDMEFEYVLSMYPDAVRIHLPKPQTESMQMEGVKPEQGQKGGAA